MQSAPAKYPAHSVLALLALIPFPLGLNLHQ